MSLPPIVGEEAGGRPPPDVPLPDRNIREEQEKALRRDLSLPYPGLPRDYVDEALAATRLFDPDKVYLFGSVVRGDDTIHSDIDLLVAVDALPRISWRDWSSAIRRAARRYCPFEVDAKMTDVEDLERRKNVVTSPCMWVRKEGILLHDRDARP